MLSHATLVSLSPLFESWDKLVKNFKEHPEIAARHDTPYLSFRDEEGYTRTSLEAIKAFPDLVERECWALWSRIIDLLDTILIDNQGGVRYDVINYLECYDYKVYPGERDSFGWLSGVCEYKGYKIVFG